MPRLQHALRHTGDFAMAKALLACALALLAATPAQAANDANDALVLRYGESDSDYERIGLGLRLAPVWSADWGAWKAQLRPELELSHFRYTGPAAGPDSLEQGGAIAHFRVRRGTGGVRPYAEAGLGVSLFSNDALGEKQFSTHFQFSEHVGLGVEFSERWFAGWQYSHYSNADIDKPNDGIDLNHLVVGMYF